MAQELQELLRERIKFPLEILCASELEIVAFYCPEDPSMAQCRSNCAIVHTRILEHEFAFPNNSFLCFHQFFTFNFCGCLDILRWRDEENRTDHIVLCVWTDIHNYPCAQYVCRWSILYNLLFRFVVNGLLTSVLRDQFLLIYLAFGFIFALKALNTSVAFVMSFEPTGTRRQAQKFIHLLSVLVADKNQDAWNKHASTRSHMCYWRLLWVHFFLSFVLKGNDFRWETKEVVYKLNSLAVKYYVNSCVKLWPSTNWTRVLDIQSLENHWRIPRHRGDRHLPYLACTGFLTHGARDHVYSGAVCLS